MTTVFAYEYCSCVYESGYSIVSLHQTKAGAYKAMRKHKLRIWEHETELGSRPEEIFFLEMFRIKKYEVLE
jgi:hypothetical protein